MHILLNYLMCVPQQYSVAGAVRYVCLGVWEGRVNLPVNFINR